MGSIYKRGQVYWIQYYHKGRPYRESTGSKLKAFAKQLLRHREGDIAKGRLPGVVYDRVTFDDLAKTLIRDYELNQRRSIDRVKLSVRHLKAFFGNSKTPTITTPRIQEYIDFRLSDGAAPATINRELSALRRMFNIAYN